MKLMTIAHAFNYRVAVLRDGVWSAVRVGRSRKAETCFLKDVNIIWGQQVTVMFQIVSTLMEEVPAFALKMRELRGEQPNVQLLRFGLNGRIRTLPNSQDRSFGLDTAGRR